MSNVHNATKVVFDNLIDLNGNKIVLQKPNGTVFTKEERNGMKKAAMNGRKAADAFKRMLMTGIYYLD